MDFEDMFSNYFLSNNNHEEVPAATVELSPCEIYCIEDDPGILRRPKKS